MPKHTLIAYVEDVPGVLNRVASLFRRRNFNIDSLTVGRTEKPEVSRMTITAEADRDQARRIEANLYKLVNVLLVEGADGTCHLRPGELRLHAVQAGASHFLEPLAVGQHLRRLRRERRRVIGTH